MMAVAALYMSNIGDILNDFVVGTGRILNSSSKQIKPDALISMNVSLLEQAQTATHTNDLPLQIDLEETLIDLDQMTNTDQIIQAVGLTNEALGVTMKMWTERARHKTMGYFLSQGGNDKYGLFGNSDSYPLCIFT